MDKIKKAISIIAANINPESEPLEIEAMLQKEFAKILRSKIATEEAISDYMFGTELSSDTDLEASVLSRLINNPTKINLCGEVGAGHFYSPQHAAVWMAISYLASHEKPIAIDTILGWLGNSGLVFDRLYVEALPNISWTDSSDESAAQFQTLVMELGQYALLRNLYRVCSEALPRIINSPSTLSMPLRYELEQQIIQSASLVGTVERFVDGEQAAANFERVYAEREIARANGIPAGLPTPIRNLTSHTGGWQPKQYYIIAGRPGQGKTSLILADILTALKNDEVVGMFSLEMSYQRLVEKMFSIEHEVDYQRIIRGELYDFEKVQLSAFTKWLATTGLCIDDTRGVDSNYIQNTAQKMLRKKGRLDRIYVDYLQLMSHVDKRYNNDELATATQATKALSGLAGHLNVPVFALSQLSRAVESRADKRPILSDLRNSGQIEQDADAVIFIYRPEYYGVLQDESGRDLRGIAELILAKFRDNNPTTIEVGFEGRYTKFKNLEDMPTSEQQFYSNPVRNVDFNIDDLN